MSLATIFYFAGVSDGIKFLMCLSCCAIFMYLLLHTFVYLDKGSKNPPAKKWIFILILLALLAVATPSKNTIYMMFGASVAESVVKDERTKELGEKLLKLANQKLDEALESKK